MMALQNYGGTVLKAMEAAFASKEGVNAEWMRIASRIYAFIFIQKSMSSCPDSKSSLIERTLHNR